MSDSKNSVSLRHLNPDSYVSTPISGVSASSMSISPGGIRILTGPLPTTHFNAETKPLQYRTPLELLRFIDPQDTETVELWSQALKRAGPMYQAMDELGRRSLAASTIAAIQTAIRTGSLPPNTAPRFSEPPPYRAQSFTEFYRACTEVGKALHKRCSELCDDPNLVEQADRIIDNVNGMLLEQVVEKRFRLKSNSRLIASLNDIFNSSRSLSENFNEVAVKLGQSFNAMGCALFSLTKNELVCIASSLHPSAIGLNPPFSFAREKSTWAHELEAKHLTVHEFVPSNEGTRFDHAFYAFGARSIVLYPLTHKGNLIGAIGLVFRDVQSPSSAEHEKLADLSSFISPYLSLHQLHDAYEQADLTVHKLFENSPNMLCSVDHLGRITRTNARFREEMGVPDDVVGMLLSWLVHPDWVPRFTTLWESIRSQTSVSQMRLDLITAESKRLPLVMETQWIQGATRKDKTLLIAFWNVSSHLEQTQAHEQQLEQLNAFTYHIAHDLRTPLRAIASFADILKEELPKDTDPDLLDITQRIIWAAEHGGELISGLLKFAQSGKNEGSSQAITIRDLLENVSRQLAGEIQARNAQIELIAEETSLLGHLIPLETLLTNLVGNAIRYTDGPSPVVRVGLYATENPGWARLTVQDFGCGIPEEDIDRLFDMFYRADKKHTGTGVGLAVVRRIARTYGGDASVTSVVGQGSTFEVRLPAT